MAAQTLMDKMDENHNIRSNGKRTGQSCKATMYVQETKGIVTTSADGK